MQSVRDVTYQLFRELGLTTIFGNVGSTEETFLKNFPRRLVAIFGPISMDGGAAASSDFDRRAKERRILHSQILRRTGGDAGSSGPRHPWL
jgi:hypothetical protein